MLISTLVLVLELAQEGNGPEVELGYGVEPAVVTNRQLDTDLDRVLVWYMSDAGIVRKRNMLAGDPNQWLTDSTITQEVGYTVLDPTLAAHPTNAHLYGGWLSTAGSSGSIQARRSPETSTLDQPQTVVSSTAADRPWLAANAQSLYCGWALGSSNVAYVRRAAIGGQPNYDLTWGSSPTSPFWTSTSPFISPHVGWAAGKVSGSLDPVHALALQYDPAQPKPFSPAINNIVHVRSPDSGITWTSTILAEISGAIG